MKSATCFSSVREGMYRKSCNFVFVIVKCKDIRNALNGKNIYKYRFFYVKKIQKDIRNALIHRKNTISNIYSYLGIGNPKKHKPGTPYYGCNTTTIVYLKFEVANCSSGIHTIVHRSPGGLGILAWLT